MAGTPDVSVIVPVYNAGPYLEACLDSVCKQATTNIEILCVDDCSTDTSLEVLRRYEKVDPRIKVFPHQKNRGCAAARNTGMQHATGKYIYFIDGDDWIDPAYLEEMLTIAENHDLPLVYNNKILLEMENGTSTLFDPGTYDTCIGFNTTGFVNNRVNIGNFAYSNCCCLYRRNYLEELQISFPEGLDYTDNYFHIATFLPQEEVFVTNNNAYHYRIHDDSICAKNRVFLCNYDIIEVYELILNYYIENDFINSCKLNFYELKKFMHRFKDTAVGYERLHRLLAKSMEAIEKNSHFYSDDELAFFRNVGSCPDIDSYNEKINPQPAQPNIQKTNDTKKRLNALRERALKNLKSGR